MEWKNTKDREWIDNKIYIIKDPYSDERYFVGYFERGDDGPWDDIINTNFVSKLKHCSHHYLYCEIQGPTEQQIESAWKGNDK